MKQVLRGSAAALAILCALGRPALADTADYQVSSTGWTQVGTAGQSIRVQALGAPVVLSTSSATPTTDQGPQAVAGAGLAAPAECLVLTQNLWAKAVGGTLATVKTETGVTCPGSSGGGGSGGAVTQADGSNVTQGSTTDQPAASPTATATIESVLRGIWAKLNGSLAVTGTFWQATQPVSAASLPLPAGAATAAGQAAIQAAPGTSAAAANGMQGVTGGVPVAVAEQDAFQPAGYPATLTALGTFGSATNGWIDTAGYSGVALQVTGTFVGSVVYEWSNDPTASSGVAAMGTLVNNGGSSADSTGDTSANARYFQASLRYFRARVSAYTSGSVTASAYLRVSPYAPRSTYVAGTGGLFGYTNGSANTGGIASFSRITSAAATTNATLAKSSAGRVFKVTGCNLSTSDVTFHFTNAATAPTPGSTAVLDSRTAPASATAGKCNPFSWDMSDIGWTFSAGIGYWVSTGAADTDATAPGASAFTLSIGYL